MTNQKSHGAGAEAVDLVEREEAWEHEQSIAQCPRDSGCQRCICLACSLLSNSWRAFEAWSEEDQILGRKDYRRR